MYLANENIPIASVRALRAAGLDVVAVVEQTPGASDVDILARAQREGRIILTFDRDYGELVFRQRLGKPLGVVYFRYDPATPEEPAEHLIRLLRIPGIRFEAKFTVVDRERMRQRPL